MSKAKKQCSVRVYSGARHDFGGHRCGHPAKVERDGKLYCAVHDPIRVKTKREEEDRKWRERREHEKRIRDQEIAKANEQKRRADAFPDLLKALAQARECLHDIATAKEGERWGWDWESVISEADAAIAKARGGA